MPRGVAGTAITLEERRLRKRIYMQNWRKTHPEHVEKYRLWAKGYYKDDNTRYLSYARKGHLKAKYGLSIEQYEEMLAAQDGVCKICGEPPSNRRLAVDHNHETDRIRGLLCFGCNGKLYALENREFREKAEAYLNAHSQG